MITDRSINEIDRLTFNSSLVFDKLMGIQISDIININQVETPQDSASINIEQKLGSILKKIRLINNQKSILREIFTDLKEIYFSSDKRAFNAKFKALQGLGRKTKKILLEQ